MHDMSHTSELKCVKLHPKRCQCHVFLDSAHGLALSAFRQQSKDI